MPASGCKRVCLFMSFSPRVRLALAGSVLVATAMACAVPWYSSRTLATSLQEMAAEYSQGDVRVRKLMHQAGWLTSHGVLEVEWRKPCAEDSTEPVWGRVEYHAQHVPDWQGLTRFTWSAAPGEGVAPWFHSGKLTGTGHVAYDGVLSTEMQLPGLVLNADGQSVQLTPSKGRMALGQTSLQLDWAFDRLGLQSGGKTLDVKHIDLRMDMKNRARGTGRMSLDIDTLSTADWAVHGMRLLSETTERADRLDSKVTESIRSAQVLGLSLKDLALEAEVKGLHTASVQTLGKVFGESCGLQRVTEPQARQWRAAWKQLLAAGFSLGVPTLQGGGEDGRLDGKLLLTVAPAQAGEVVLARQVSSSGQISIQGNLMPPEQRAFALSTGYVNPLPDGVQAGFEYGGGTLTVSGKTWDGALVQLGLQRLDAWLQAFLSGESQEPLVMEPPLVPPTEAPSPALVPVPAS